MVDGGKIRWIAGKLLGLPPRQARVLNVDRNIPVPMRDGVELLADHYAAPQSSSPVILIRSPYGRGSIFGLMAALLAERGFHAVVQSVRGTCGSGGQFDPMRQEQADGADTLDWVRAQPWFDGRLYTYGISYLGNAQWAMASEAPEKIDGQAMAMTLSNFSDELLSFGGFTQAGMLGWTELMRGMVNWKAKRGLGRLKPNSLDHIHGHLPLGTIDHAAFGEPAPWWQDWVAHANPEDPWWDKIDHSAAVDRLEAPVTMVAGWQDIFLPFQLRDYAARAAAGRPTWLTIGPWTHSAPGGMIAVLKQAITLFTALRDGKPPYEDRGRVRLYLQGAGIWRDYPSWPPQGGSTLRFHLRSNGRLDISQPSSHEGAVRYIYDPADPTPAVHGPTVMSKSKKRDMTALEQRRDTVSFSSDPLDRDMDVIGPVSVELAVRSDRENTDFYACLCDVDGKGRPMQVVDGYVRLRPDNPAADEGGVRRIIVDCWPTAYRFRRGHRLRLIVGSGAHPRYARNLGTGERLATATEMLPAHQEILLGAQYGASVVMSAFR